MLGAAALRARLGAIAPGRIDGPFARALWLEYVVAALGHAPNILSGNHSQQAGGRYNPPSAFPCTYLAGSDETATREAKHRFTGSGIIADVERPLTLFTIRGRVERVLDLLEDATKAELDTTLKELTAPYLPYQLKGQEAPTQLLGRIAHESTDFEAIRVPSVPHPEGWNLVVFPDRVVAPSHLEVYDPAGNVAEKLPPGTGPTPTGPRRRIVI